MTHTSIAASATPEWLTVMRSMTGLLESPGDADNPKILAMRDTIALAYPEMATYCNEYQHDDTPWCGLAAAYAMTMAGIRPVFGPTDTDRFYWAQAWDDPSFGTLLDDPVLGCVVVLKRSGGGHVTFYESTSGSNYMCRGGNQSDSVNLSPQSISNVIALVWPNEAGPVPPADRRQLSNGMSGSDVESLQESLGLPADGEFGGITETQVKAFQAAVGLSADGVVGPQTWTAVDGLDLRMEEGSDGIDETETAAIVEMAKKSDIADYEWPGRGYPPPGYIPGMACTYALALKRLQAEVPDAISMAQAVTNSSTDALNVYKAEFANLDMDNSVDGVDTLRHLFVMMIGLGMRESSGKYCEGRDMSASNTSSDTCEAGLFQTSWNIRSTDPAIPMLMDEYVDDPNGFLEVFSEDVSPTSNNLSTYGTGQGATYQFLAKFSPAFAALVAGVGMRTRSNHWGPINRKEVTLNPNADKMLKDVETILEEGPDPNPEPEPEPGDVPEVALTTKGEVIVKVNGKVVS